jgi:hypothetical protein
VLPQVLAGLGALSVLSASCLLWLQRLQPLFAAIALGALAVQVALVLRRPRHRRSGRMLAILWTSVAVSGLVFLTWIALWYRYR